MRWPYAQVRRRTPRACTWPSQATPTLAEAFANEPPAADPREWVDLQAACDALGLKLKADTYEASTTLRISRPEESG